jgi:pSer/pThr/pTyr-binding forkhead associated (FHA) protein
MVGERLLKVRVTLKGRPVRTQVLHKEMLMIGRSPEADIFLDNPGISREHARLTGTARGTYMLEDLGSANGTFVNDVRVDRHELQGNDVIRIGKFALWVGYELDRRGSDNGPRVSPTSDEGTTVLSSQELQDMIEVTRKAEASQRPGSPAVTAFETPRPPLRVIVLAVALIAFLAGSVIGASATLYLTR